MDHQRSGRRTAGDGPGAHSRGGVSPFVVEADSPGITVERRNKFMGLRGIENGVTRFHRVRVPRENLIGREGDGLKIALTTLNAGRLSIPATAAGASKWSLKIAREWSAERYETAESLATPGSAPFRPSRCWRSADQPHLRGIQRDHAVADRPGGGRRAPERGRRPREARRRSEEEGGRGGRRQRVLRKVVAAAGFRRRPTAFGLQRVRCVGGSSPVHRTLRPKAGPQHLLRDGAVAGQARAEAGLFGPHRRHRRRAVRDVGGRPGAF